jgi:hypothetical protein
MPVNPASTNDHLHGLNIPSNYGETSTATVLSNVQQQQQHYTKTVNDLMPLINPVNANSSTSSSSSTVPSSLSASSSSSSSLTNVNESQENELTTLKISHKQQNGGSTTQKPSKHDNATTVKSISNVLIL